MMVVYPIPVLFVRPCLFAGISYHPGGHEGQLLNTLSTHCPSLRRLHLTFGGYFSPVHPNQGAKEHHDRGAQEVNDETIMNLLQSCPGLQDVKIECSGHTCSDLVLDFFQQSRGPNASLIIRATRQWKGNDVNMQKSLYSMSQLSGTSSSSSSSSSSNSQPFMEAPHMEEEKEDDENGERVDDMDDCKEIEKEKVEE